MTNQPALWQLATSIYVAAYNRHPDDAAFCEAIPRILRWLSDSDFSDQPTVGQLAEEWIAYDEFFAGGDDDDATTQS